MTSYFHIRSSRLHKPFDKEQRVRMLSNPLCNAERTNPRTGRPDGFNSSRPTKTDGSVELKLMNGIVESLQKAVQRSNGAKVRIPLNHHNSTPNQISLKFLLPSFLFHAVSCHVRDERYSWVLNFLGPDVCSIADVRWNITAPCRPFTVRPAFSDNEWSQVRVICDYALIFCPR